MRSIPMTRAGSEPGMSTSTVVTTSPRVPEALTWPSVADVVRQVGISQGYVSRLLKAGKLHGYKSRLGWLLDPASVAEYAAAREARLRERAS